MTKTDDSPAASIVPLIDMEQWRSGDPEERRQTAEAVDTALTEVGFLIITNHGVANDLIDDVRSACADVFALPAENKLRYRQGDGIGGPGWTPIGAEANAYASGKASPPDLKETWTVGPCAPGAVAADLPPETFNLQCTPPLHNLNLTWYPPMTDGDDVLEPEPGQFRIGPHSDFGTITILQREASDPPLQVELVDGTWADLPHVPDALIVNTGDQVAYWSGGRWRSNPHRIPAPTGEAAREGRLSLVLFLETAMGAVLQPIGRPDDEPMDAVQFLIDKLVAIDTAVG